MSNEYDYMIVGSGLFGLVLAQKIASVLDKSVVIIEKRNHIGGNCYSLTCKDSDIEYHKYGTHIFHTSSKKIWDYINQFTSFNGYYHQVLSCYNNKMYQLPFNLETINSFYNINLKPFEVDNFLEELLKKEKNVTGNPKNLEEKAISMIGKDLYEAFIKGYTTKQWGKDPKELPASIINRIPFRKDYNESYFNNSRWQGIPIDGYTSAFNKMIDHKKIKLHLDCDYFLNKNNFTIREKTIFTGPIDQFYDYKLGKLDWRGLSFEKEVMDVEDWQGTSVVNYPQLEFPYTRIHEPRHLHPERQYGKKTLIIKEFSKWDTIDPYYPVNDEKNKELFKKYQELSKSERNVLFGGRLGEYAYYDMDVTIGAALSCFEKKINGNSLHESL